MGGVPSFPPTKGIPMKIFVSVSLAVAIAVTGAIIPTKPGVGVQGGGGYCCIKQ